MQTKPILSATKKVCTEMLLTKLILDIKAKWSVALAREVIIQQDNVRPHISKNDQEFNHAASEDGWNIRLSMQPPNSPDMNVLDLGFFNSIQSLQYQTCNKTVDELLANVQEACTRLSPKTLNHVWLTLQFIMAEIIKVKKGITTSFNILESTDGKDKVFFLPTL
ncbi:unnamed protein product [Cuscuta epithymum]|uniref:Transposase n=1 Tax=Cuscuta epithymum TaxID=186058 RepID=A0AAV0GBW9_9ASTE|nr:unnamed protein product [Cuscuta epithymum]CAH9145123.1 unnamed protein product [Cuscuta epithymum]